MPTIVGIAFLNQTNCCFGQYAYLAGASNQQMLSLSLAPISISNPSQTSHFAMRYAISHRNSPDDELAPSAEIFSIGSTVSSAQVAAVVSAYRDGGAIVDRIKQKRLAKQAPPPTRLLEASLARGPAAVEEAKENGIERFGDRYAAGDSLAVNSLKDIVIDLQGSVIKHLRQAHEDDDMTDFTILVDASDIGRIRAVTVLNELYMRIAMGDTIAQAPFGDMGSFMNPRMAAQFGHTLTTVRPQAAIGPPSQPSGDNRVEQPNLAHAETAGKQVGPPTSPRHAFFDRFRRKSSTEESSSSPSSSRRSSRIQPRRDSSPSGRHDDKALPLTPMILPQATIDEDNPWVTEGSEPIPIPQEPPPNKSISRATTLVPSIRRRTSTASSAWSTSTSKARTISPFEVHKGFCKGAHRLQENETDALRLQNRSDAQRVEDYYWACCSSKCAFEGPARVDGRKWAFDDTIRESHGVRYRWPFLAKAHIAQSKVQNGRYDYGCVFCIHDGYECPVFHGIQELMEHVRLHRETRISVLMLQKTKCINGRIAGHDEQFDINLKPVEGKPDSVSASDTTHSSQSGTINAAASDGGSWSARDETMADVDAWRDTI
ncbi:MAG: hypothetical protein Q9185_003543 [Variospora sp. 1 TL-2023]